MGIKELRKHLARYLKDFPGSSELRKQAVLVSNYQDVKEVLKQL